jgi:hypothetical protein
MMLLSVVGEYTVGFYLVSSLYCRSLNGVWVAAVLCVLPLLFSRKTLCGILHMYSVLGVLWSSSRWEPEKLWQDF